MLCNKQMECTSHISLQSVDVLLFSFPNCDFIIFSLQTENLKTKYFRKHFPAFHIIIHNLLSAVFIMLNISTHIILHVHIFIPSTNIIKYRVSREYCDNVSSICFVAFHLKTIYENYSIKVKFVSSVSLYYTLERPSVIFH